MNPVKNESDERINISQGKETSIIVILQENMTYLQNKLSSKNEIIKSVMEIELSVFQTMPNNSSTSQNYNSTKINYSIIYNLSLSNETFIHIFSAIS